MGQVLQDTLLLCIRPSVFPVDGHVSLLNIYPNHVHYYHYLLFLSPVLLAVFIFSGMLAEARGTVSVHGGGVLPAAGPRATPTLSKMCTASNRASNR